MKTHGRHHGVLRPLADVDCGGRVEAGRGKGVRGSDHYPLGSAGDSSLRNRLLYLLPPVQSPLVQAWPGLVGHPVFQVKKPSAPGKQPGSPDQPHRLGPSLALVLRNRLMSCRANRGILKNHFDPAGLDHSPNAHRCSANLGPPRSPAADLPTGVLGLSACGQVPLCTATAAALPLASGSEPCAWPFAGSLPAAAASRSPSSKPHTAAAASQGCNYHKGFAEAQSCPGCAVKCWHDLVACDLNRSHMLKARRVYLAGSWGR